MILMLWTFVFGFVVYCPHFFYSMVYIISLQSKFSPGPKKKYPHREKTTPFPTRPVFLTPDRTDPRFKQNMAPWPESGRGCTVRSGNPRRSGVPRSSLVELIWPSVTRYKPKLTHGLTCHFMLDRLHWCTKQRNRTSVLLGELWYTYQAI